MSTKWRRSKKYLRWLDLNDSERNRARNRSKTLRLKKMRTTSTYSQKRRNSQNLEKNDWEEQKPLIDIFQENNWIIIIAQIAGFNKETLKINVTDQKLTLSSKVKDRKYYKSLNLPKVVIPNVIQTTYKNGVLKIKLKKAVKEQTASQRS